MGLLSYLVPDGQQLDNFALEVAGKLGQRAPWGTFIGKWAFWKQLEMDIEQAYAFGSEVMSSVRELEDAKIGVSAWMEGRKPQWP